MQPLTDLLGQYDGAHFLLEDRAAWRAGPLQALIRSTQCGG